MREIKFRAWNKEKKEMKLLHYYDGWSWWDGNPCVRNGPLLEIMQYTGLKDKNGKEIYEGDVVIVRSQYETDKPIECNTRVLFRDGKFTTDFHDLHLGKNVCEGIGNWNIEVIGNIYENPELLKVKQ